MGEEEKRWSVTYTKHIKQKRKVYQDGFLDLHISTSKLMLYDESGKLLECRMLRKDEVVCSGQTLTFAAYFVDVGLLHSPHLNSSDAGRKSNEARRPLNPRLSPSQKIIREFKKSEMQKYIAPQTGPTTTKTSVTDRKTLIKKECLAVNGGDEGSELVSKRMDIAYQLSQLCANKWQVMYTTQVTQKAKKYHDGFLQLKNSGTLQRQIMLYDASKTLINSRFLKKDEVIQSGESIAFAAHLVNIEEAEGNYQGPTPMDSDVCVSNYSVAGKTGMINRVQNCLKTNKSFWKGKSQKIPSSKVNADPSFSISIIDGTKSSRNVSANKPLRDATQILSILQKPRMQDTLSTQSIDRNIIDPAPSVKEPQNSDSTRNILDRSPLPRISIAHHGSSGEPDNLESSESVDIKKSPDIYSKGKFKCIHVQLQHYLLMDFPNYN
ncbi:hypothetical protein DITRI_Ditri05aG0146000 [Diplodiscus trichospermus]